MPSVAHKVYGPEQLSGPVQRALDAMARGVSLDPTIRHAIGELMYFEETREWWSFPTGEGVALGPFFDSEEAERALTTHAANGGSHAE